MSFHLIGKLCHQKQHHSIFELSLEHAWRGLPWQLSHSWWFCILCCSNWPLNPVFQWGYVTPSCTKARITLLQSPLSIFFLYIKVWAPYAFFLNICSRRVCDLWISFQDSKRSDTKYFLWNRSFCSQSAEHSQASLMVQSRNTEDLKSHFENRVQEMHAEVLEAKIKKDVLCIIF